MRYRRGRSRLVLALAATALPALFATAAGAVEAPVPVPEVTVTVPTVTVPPVTVTIPPVTVPELPVTVPLTVPVPVTTAPESLPASPSLAPSAATSAGDDTTRAPAAPLPIAEPTSPPPSLKPMSLLAATRAAGVPFAVPLAGMALIATYVLVRAALDRRDARLASAPVEDRWVGFR